MIFGNILKHNFADIQGNGWKILRNIGWSIYTTKAFWQHFPLMRWKKFCHISKICLKLLIILMLQKKSRVYKAVKKKMAYCRNLTFEHYKTMYHQIRSKKKYKYINSLSKPSYHHDKRSKCGAFNDMAFHAAIFVA